MEVAKVQNLYEKQIVYKLIIIDLFYMLQYFIFSNSMIMNIIPNLDKQL